ncbi:MAG: hypothetical protein ACJAZV_000671 [Roseivirga sp.]|jgi:hypothetical protein
MMIISDRLEWISKQSDFPLWIASIAENNICELSRASGFQIDTENRTIAIFLPQSMFSMIEPTLKANSKISLLMASLKDFESYQVKGSYLRHSLSTEEQVDFYYENIKKTIEEINVLGLYGEGILGYLLEKPSFAITMKYEEVFEQTPKPGTGHKISDLA